MSWGVGPAHLLLTDAHVSPGHVKGYVLSARVAREKFVYWQREMREIVLS